MTLYTLLTRWSSVKVSVRYFYLVFIIYTAPQLIHIWAPSKPSHTWAVTRQICNGNLDALGYKDVENPRFGRIRFGAPKVHKESENAKRSQNVKR